MIRPRYMICTSSPFKCKDAKATSEQNAELPCPRTPDSSLNHASNKKHLYVVHTTQPSTSSASAKASAAATAAPASHPSKASAASAPRISHSSASSNPSDYSQRNSDSAAQPDFRYRCRSSSSHSARQIHYAGLAVASSDHRPRLWVRGVVSSRARDA